MTLDVQDDFTIKDSQVIDAIETTLTDDDTKLATSKAIKEYIDSL